MTDLLIPRGYQDIEALNLRLHLETEEYWIRRGEERALRLFHEMAERVPAYRDFLRERNFSPNSVISYEDFQRIPPLDKDNYLRKYPKDMLCWDGIFGRGRWVVSTTSGSTGEPYYFPREKSQDMQYAATAELYLRNNFEIHKRKTLYIVAFPMGAWIGGVFTYEALKIVGERGGYDLSIITPGIHKQEVINAVKQLGQFFDQIIIGVYAPFLKDILDDGVRQGVDWKKYNIGFVFSAEAFTERFRDYVLEVSGAQDRLRATLNHYGTVDLGTMAHETPEAILIRRELEAAGKLAAVFPEARRQPTLCQFNPELFHFEDIDNNLLCSAYSGIPLVRYNLKDYGGVITRSDIISRAQEHGIDVQELSAANDITDISWNLPYVYVYERNDFSVSYYASLIYPDTIRRALDASNLARHITGKFSMHVDYAKDGRQRFNLHIETRPDTERTDKLKEQLRQTVHAALVRESSEYRNTARTIGDSFGVTVHLWGYEDPTYFKPGTKQKWVVK